MNESIYKVACINPSSNESVLLMVWANGDSQAKSRAESSDYLSDDYGWFIICEKCNESDNELIPKSIKVEVDDDGDRFEWDINVVKIDSDYTGPIFQGN